MDNTLFTPKALANRWNVTPQTLSQWRWNGRGPLFIKMGKGVLYRLRDIEQFEDQQTRQHTSRYSIKVSPSNPSNLLCR